MLASGENMSVVEICSERPMAHVRGGSDVLTCISMSVVELFLLQTKKHVRGGTVLF